MMITFRYRLPSEAVNITTGQNVFSSRGELYIETEYGYFPCIGWKDRICSVVVQWLSNAMTLPNVEIEAQQITNSFMNGPYFFEIKKMNRDLLKIRFLRRFSESGDREDLPFIPITTSDYCNALLRLSQEVICDAHFQSFGKEAERMYFAQSLTLFKEKLNFGEN